jgi:DUF1680 family protein
VIAPAACSLDTLTLADNVEALGETREHLQSAYDRLCAPPLGDLDFVLSDVNFKLTRRFTQYSGDISGRMLGALNATAPLLDKPNKMLKLLDAAFPEYQKDDGHFGAEQDLDKGVKGQRDMPILWGNGRLLLALVERYRDTGDKKLLDVAKRMGDYIISTRKYFGLEENFTKVGGAFASGYTTCYPSVIDGLAGLGEITGDQSYYNEARFIAKLSLLDSAFAAHHSHGRLTAYRGMLDLDRFTNTNEFLNIVKTSYATIVRDYLLPTGGVSEGFDRHDSRDEGCSEGDWIRVSFLLWRATGDPAYLDRAECAVRNHLYALQFDNGGFGHHYWHALKDNGHEYHATAIDNVGTEAYWCCSMHGTQIIADIAKWSVMTCDNEILVTWLGETKTTVMVNKKSVTATVTQQSDDLWTVKLESDKPVETALRLRIPSWTPAIGINGQNYESHTGWVTLPVHLDETETRQVRFNRNIRVAGVYSDKIKQNEPVRIFAGAELLCLPDTHVPTGHLERDTVPTVLLSKTNHDIDNHKVIVISNDRKSKCLSQLVPMSKRPSTGCRFLFNIKYVNDDEFKPFDKPYNRPGIPIEIVLACDGRYDLYLNGERIIGQTGNAWRESPYLNVLAKPGKNIIAVKAIGSKDQPGIITKIDTREQIFVSNIKDWTAIPCPKELTQDVLTRMNHSKKWNLKLKDKGGFGAPPWLHINAAYASSNAHWLWVNDEDAKKKNVYLFRYEFTLPSK